MKSKRSGVVIPRAVRQQAITANQRNDGTTTAIATGALGALSNVSTPIVANCAPDDNSFMCKMTRFYNSTKMIISIIVLFIVVAIVLYLGTKWLKGFMSSNR